MHIVIIGGGAVGQMLATQLDTTYNEVVFIDEDEHVIERATERGLAATAIDDIRKSASAETLDVDLTTIIVVATGRDSANLLLAQLIRTRFDVDRLIVRVNEPQNHSVFAEASIEPVCASTALADALDRQCRGVALVETDRSSKQEQAKRRERVRSDEEEGDA